MTINDLIKIYETKKVKYGIEAYRHISNVLKEAKELHKKDFSESDKNKEKISKGGIPDHEQSWRAFKGKNLEKVIEYIITDIFLKLLLQQNSDTALTLENEINFVGLLCDM